MAHSVLSAPMASIGVPTEIKSDEQRVALTPDGARELVMQGLEVRVQSGAGAGAGISDDAFAAAGARVVDREEAWAAHLVVKVKEPQEEEFPFLRDDMVLFTYLHLAAYPKVGQALLDAGTTGVAYELRTAGRRGTPDRIERWIEAPRPKGPVSCAVFLHEVGHHAIGLGAVSPRCLEEYHAWRWATEGLAAAGIPVGPSVERRMREGLEYAVAKALRRGLRRLPSELTPYLPPRRRVGAR